MTLSVTYLFLSSVKHIVKHIPLIGGSLHYFSIYTLKKREILWGEGSFITNFAFLG